jgi:hypothetical protein
VRLLPPGRRRLGAAGAPHVRQLPSPPRRRAAPRGHLRELPQGPNARTRRATKPGRPRRAVAHLHRPARLRLVPPPARPRRLPQAAGMHPVSRARWPAPPAPPALAPAELQQLPRRSRAHRPQRSRHLPWLPQGSDHSRAHRQELRDLSPVHRVTDTLGPVTAIGCHVNARSRAAASSSKTSGRTRTQAFARAASPWNDLERSAAPQVAVCVAVIPHLGEL